MLAPIQFTGHKVEVTPILKEFTEKKFQRLNKHAECITSMHVIFNVDKLLQIAEAKIHVPGNEVYACAESEDMYKTIDLLLDKLIAQLDKIKGKRNYK